MNLLQPNLMVESVFAIDLAMLRSKGISGLLVDLDNTIVPWEDSQPSNEFILWVQEAKEQGFSLCLVTNALEKRTNHFAELLAVPAVGRAWKPLRVAFRRGLTKLGLDQGQVAVIGDQMFTDILGGNRMGLFTILVNPLSEKELGTTKLVRKMENRMLNRLVKQGKLSGEAVKLRRGEQ